jgi:hypothetical protein
MISVENSSVPFRAFLGALLSVIEGVDVQPSESIPDQQLDPIEEETDDGPSPEDDIDDGSGAYPGSAGALSANPPMTRSRARANRGNTESGLMACSSIPLFIPSLIHSFSGYRVFPEFS